MPTRIRKRREKVEARNQLEALINSTEAALKEADDKVDDSIKSEVESAVTPRRRRNSNRTSEEDLAAASQALDGSRP